MSVRIWAFNLTTMTTIDGHKVEEIKRDMRYVTYSVHGKEHCVGNGHSIEVDEPSD